MIANSEHSAKQALAVAATIVPSSIDFGRETCCSLDAARDREWLVTNGIGGFDVALGRSGKVALRPQGDYFGMRVNGSVVSNVRLSLGIVFRIGTK